MVRNLVRAALWPWFLYRWLEEPIPDENDWCFL
jgi:hypothetical protein